MRGAGPVATDGGTIIRVDGPSGPLTATFRAPGVPLEGEQADATLCAALLPAMRAGRDLEVDGPVSPRLLAGAATVQDVFWTWDRTLRPAAPWYRRVAVTPTSVREADRPDERITAAFFTGGVDSFHTALENRDRLDALVHVHGFDRRLGTGALRAEVGRRVAAAATALGLPLIEVDTDLWELGHRGGVPWPDYHGAALATVAHLLAPRLGRVLVPATHTYGHLEGLGSHPLVDPLWSSADLEVVHHGADATRTDKLRRIADEPAARAHLRVCWENRDGAYNCGRCEKCVRTGTAVRVAGLEGRFPTIRPPRLAEVARVRVTGRGAEWHDLRADLVRTGANPRLRRAIDAALARHQLHRWRWTRRWTP